MHEECCTEVHLQQVGKGKRRAAVDICQQTGLIWKTGLL